MAKGSIEIEIKGRSFGIGKVLRGPAVELIEVVKTELTKVGDGSEDDPVRVVTEYWSTDGELLATVDPIAESPSSA